MDLFDPDDDGDDDAGDDDYGDGDDDDSDNRDGGGEDEEEEDNVDDDDDDAGYIEKNDEIFAHGAKEIVVISVNDAYVMNAWSNTFPPQSKVRPHTAIDMVLHTQRALGATMVISG
jgi:hypothetical protein